jgi:hypothetical protein
MSMEPGNSLSPSGHPQVSRRPTRSFRSLQWLNGGVHWISAVVLVYAFISNGETTRALMNPVAMRGEVKLGLVVGLIFTLLCMSGGYSGPLFTNSSPTVAGGVIYIGTDDGYLLAYDESSCITGTLGNPIWTSPQMLTASGAPDPVFSPPVVSYDRVHSQRSGLHRDLRCLGPEARAKFWDPSEWPR